MQPAPPIYCTVVHMLRWANFAAAWQCRMDALKLRYLITCGFDFSFDVFV